MRTLRDIFVCLLLVTAVSCNRPFPGYKEHAGIYYKLLKIGEQHKHCDIGNYVMANISYLTMDDSVFFSGVRKFKLAEPSFPGSIDHCFPLLYEQDSAEFIISLPDFFEKTLAQPIPDYLNGQTVMRVAVRLLEIQTQEEYLKEKETFLRWVKDVGEHEKSLLQKYIQNEKITVSPTEDGIYYVVQRAGTGAQVKYGDMVAIHYDGYFLDGKKFDSTRLHDEPFQFVYGEQQQVIGGFEKIIGKMHAGEKALVVMPSKEAFGEKGSLGIVPPYTSVIYEIELIHVK